MDKEIVAEIMSRYKDLTWGLTIAFIICFSALVFTYIKYWYLSKKYEALKDSTIGQITHPVGQSEEVKTVTATNNYNDKYLIYNTKNNIIVECEKYGDECQKRWLK